MGERRGPTREEELAVGDEVYRLLNDYHDAAYRYGCAVMRHSTSKEQCDEAMRVARSAREAVVIAIAARIKEAREDAKCAHDPKDLGTARITKPDGRVRWGTICTRCETIVADPGEIAREAAR